MKNLITILPLLLSIIYGCSTKEEKKDEVREEPIAQKQEIVKEEKPLVVNYKTLKGLINGSRLIPLDFFAGSDIFPKDSLYGARIYLLEENNNIMIGEVYFFEKANKNSYSTFIGVFSKEDGMLKSYLVGVDKESSDNSKKRKFLGFSEQNNLIKFAMLEPVIIDSLEQDEIINRKILFKVSDNGEMLATDTLEYLDVKKFKAFIKEFKNNQDLTEYQEEAYYSKFAEISIQQVNYFETIFSSDDILVFRVRWSISDQTLESIWVYTVYGEFKSSCEVIYPFEDYGVKIKKESFEVVDKKKRKISISIDWTEYELIPDDEAGFYFGDKTVGNGEWSLLIGDDFTCELVEGIVEKTKISFLDFIEKFKNREDISDYEREPYYFLFDGISYGGRTEVTFLFSSDKMQVLRAQWEQADSYADLIRVYDNYGNLLSSCQGDYPSDASYNTIKEFSFDKVSENPLEFSIYAKWTQSEMDFDEEGAADLGESQELEGKWILKVDEQFQCSVKEVEL